LSSHSNYTNDIVATYHIKKRSKIKLFTNKLKKTSNGEILRFLLLGVWSVALSNCTDSLTPIEDPANSTENVDMFYMNWGWNGNGNGWVDQADWSSSAGGSLNYQRKLYYDLIPK
jgi:hypothetical protein